MRVFQGSTDEVVSPRDAGLAARISERRLVSDGRFKKGEDPRRGRGRPKGSRNLVTPEMRKAIIEAAEMVGSDGKGKGGLTGYLVRLARMENPVIFGKLLRRSIPPEIHTTPDLFADLKVRSTE